ncbi:MAG: DJ-1/PfpI family protein, partial [Pseudonocardia sp.]
MASMVNAPRTVSVLLHDGTTPVELGIISAVFSSPFEGELYRLSICSEAAKPVPIPGGATVHVDHDLDTFAAAHTVIAPGADVYKGCSPEVIEALRLARKRGSRIVSVYTGVFALAATGLLDGRRVSTHWRFADLLAQRYPLVEVDSTALYVDDDDLVTGAGCAASLDLFLHLVRKDFGPTIASSIARQLVMPPHRDGGHAQYVSPLGIVDEQDEDPIVR